MNKTNFQWDSKIIDRLYLGAIPLKDRDGLKMIQARQINTVLSLNEDFELLPSVVAAPLNKIDYEKNRIKFLQIKAQDFIPLSLFQIKQAVDFLEQEIAKDRNVYVHCKAGRGRSATVVICYLLKSDLFHSVQEAIAFTKNVRPQINLRASQIDAVKKYFSHIKSLSISA